MEKAEIRRQKAIEIIVRNIFKLDDNGVEYYATNIAQDLGFDGVLTICDDDGLNEEYKVNSLFE